MTTDWWQLWPSLNLGKSAPFFDFFDHGKAYVWLYWILANFFRHWTIHQDMERLMLHKKMQRLQKKWNKNLHENAWFFSRWHSKDSVHAAFGPGSQRARDSASVASSHWGTLPLLPWSFCLGPALRRKKNTKVTTKLSRQEAPDSVEGVKRLCIYNVDDDNDDVFVDDDVDDADDDDAAASILCEPAQSKCTWTCHKRHFVREFTRKMPYAYPATSVLCEPAQSKCTWTCHKSQFVEKFTGKMPDASDTTSIEHRPLTVTVRTPQCATLFGKKNHSCQFPKDSNIF